MTLCLKRDIIVSTEVITVAITLKAARVNLGYTQKEAGLKIGVSKDTIGSWERNLSTPNSKYIPVIERVYGVSYNDLIFLPRNNA